MPKPPNLQKSPDRLVPYLGAQIAKAVAERVGKKLAQKKAAARKKPGRKGKAGPAKGRQARRRRGKPKKCSIRGCKNPARSKGLCSKHYQKARYAALHGKKSARKAQKAQKAQKVKKARKAIRPRKKAAAPVSAPKPAEG